MTVWHKPPTREIITEMLIKNSNATKLEISEAVCKRQGRKFQLLGTDIVQVKKSLGIPVRQYRKNVLYAKNVKPWCVSANCPKCDGELTQSGSMMINLFQDTSNLICNDCGAKVELKKKPKE